MALGARVLRILADEMGPAGEDFLLEECHERLGKSPDDLLPADLPVVAQAVQEVAGPVLGEGMASRLAARIRAVRA